MGKGGRRAQIPKPWYKRTRKRMPPPTRIENPSRGGAYKRERWKEESSREYKNSGP